MVRRFILCVDDDIVQLGLHRALLETSGYEVATCQNGPQSLEIFRAREVGLVVLDYAMPRMNGAEVARAMRLERVNVPIIMLSGQAERPAGVLDAVDAYISKGGNPNRLLSVIASLMERASAVATLERKPVQSSSAAERKSPETKNNQRLSGVKP